METSADHARLGSIEYTLVRSKLRAWLALEDFHINIIQAAEKGDREKFVSSIYSYISAALSIPSDKLQEYPWYEVIDTFKKIVNVNLINFDFPILHTAEEKKKFTKNGWEYVGRDWFVWLHTLSKEYGWNAEYVENLDVDVGVALFQEIMVEDQLDKEWQWSLSQSAYSYDEYTKKSKYIPLDRPNWMKEVPKEIEKIKIRASELPVGVILRWDTDTNEYTKSQ